MPTRLNHNTTGTGVEVGARVETYPVVPDPPLLDTYPPHFPRSRSPKGVGRALTRPLRVAKPRVNK